MKQRDEVDEKGVFTYQISFLAVNILFFRTKTQKSYKFLLLL